MKCVICKHGETHPGVETVTLERSSTTLVIKRIPAEICDNCGESYLSESVTTELLKTAEQTASTGVQVEIRRYIAA